VVLRPDKLDQPLRWTRPRRIFVNSMSDLFHKDVPDEYIARVFAVMAMASQHTFLILTKRHARMRSFLQDNCQCGKGHVPGIHLRSAMDWAGTMHSPTYVPGVVGHDVYHNRPWPLPNVWLGVSAEDQHWADIRIPALLGTPAAVRFVSAEPLLGRIDLRSHLAGSCPEHDFPGGFCVERDHPGVRHLDWLIVGGESGPGARPMNEQWARTLAIQATRAQVPVFMKQLGSVLGKQLGAGSKGGDMAAWPEDLRIREFPRVTEMTGAA
jgi:protein gp37